MQQSRNEIQNFPQQTEDFLQSGKTQCHGFCFYLCHAAFLSPSGAEGNVRFQRVTVISHFPKISTRNTSPAPSGAEMKTPAEHNPLYSLESRTVTARRGDALPPDTPPTNSPPAHSPQKN